MKYFTYIKNITPAHKSIIEHNESHVDFTVLTESPFSTEDDEIAPILWLRENPDLVWMAPNVQIFKNIDFEMIRRMAYFLNDKGQANASVIFGNKDRPLFSDIIKRSKHTWQAVNQYVCEKKYRVGLIPKVYFKIKRI